MLVTETFLTQSENQLSWFMKNYYLEFKGSIKDAFLIPKIYSYLRKLYITADNNVTLDLDRDMF